MHGLVEPHFLLPGKALEAFQTADFRRKQLQTFKANPAAFKSGLNLNHEQVFYYYSWQQRTTLGSEYGVSRCVLHTEGCCLSAQTSQSCWNKEDRHCLSLQQHTNKWETLSRTAWAQTGVGKINCFINMTNSQAFWNEWIWNFLPMLGIIVQSWSRWSNSLCACLESSLPNGSERLGYTLFVVVAENVKRRMSTWWYGDFDSWFDDWTFSNQSIWVSHHFLLITVNNVKKIKVPQCASRQRSWKATVVQKEVFQCQIHPDRSGHPQPCSHGERLLHLPQCSRLSGVPRI